jgi:hypothetical protein
MAAEQSIDDLIAALEQSVEDGLAHFRRLEAESKIEMGKKGPRETLCHLVWWHQVSAEGMESVASGGAPYRIYASTDEMNARAVGRAAGQTVAQMADRVQQWQTRLVAAARALPDPQAAVFVHANGSQDTALQRLETMIQRWHVCIEELQAV